MEITANWLGVFSAVLSLGAFYLCYGIGEKISSDRRILLAVLAIVCALPGLSFSLYYLHMASVPEWYYAFRSRLGTELLIVFIGCAGGLITTFLPRKMQVLPFLGVVLFSVAPFIKPFIGPIPSNKFQDDWDEGVCLQSTPSTCGAAAVATVLKQFGSEVTEAEIAFEAYSYVAGTEAWYLARVIRARGGDVDFDFSDSSLPNEQFPVIVGVRLGTIGHFIPILGREGDLYQIGDPLNGRETLSRQEMTDRYEFTTFKMYIR